MVGLQKSWARLLAFFAAALAACAAKAQDESAAPFLQIFEARYSTIENRMADIFDVGYGRLWLPPPSRAETGGLSVGYDVFDRFDLGKPGNPTLYGTEKGLKTVVRAAHNAGVLVNTDFVPNHNGFLDSSSVDNRGTPANPADDVSFVQAGGYPGFILTPNDGDFHGAFEGGEEHFRLAGLIDIAQEKNLQFIRSPVEAGNPQNIPAGTQGAYGRPPQNVPDANNRRFYPDQGLGGTVVFDPRINQNVTLFDFNTTTPLAGDAVSENALGLIMRSARWMVQEVGVDGFRIDAGRHFPRWVLDYIDQAIFRADKDPLLDGSTQQPYSFIETGYDNVGFLQPFIRKDINNGNLGQVGGNRDALDFNLFGAMTHNLSGNGFQNNWHSIRNASIDLNDDGLRNGSQGVSFAQSHDEFGPFLQNVAYAYTLMRPGNAIVYTNALEFGDNRDFPKDGKVDALGGFYGETITKLVELRNSHGRGNFHERWIDQAFDPNPFSNIYIYERSKSAVVGLSSRLDAGYDERAPVQTDFAPGTVLVELTGNSADATVDPSNDIPDAIRVNGSGQVTLRVPRNSGHGRGYVVYGVAGPQGTLSLTNVSQTLEGATPTAANNGTARLADIDVITANSFTVQLNTTPVTLPTPAGESNPVRDVHADGDHAMLKIDGGLNINGNSAVDVVTPGNIAYGFEDFVTTRTPGYIWNGSANVGTGSGTYAQTIDTTQLSEGRHSITVRAFRHRNSSSGGDGGPAVFTDFKRTVYIDRLAPESQIVSFAPFASNPGNPNNRDLIVRSTDGTANNVHIYLDLPASTTEAQILSLVQLGVNHAGNYDRDEFVFGFGGLRTGNHVATVVTFEESGNFNIQRLPGQFTDTNLGLGFGDMVGTGFAVSDILCSGACNNGSVEDILYSQNTKFRATFDVTGDGLGDNRDLFALGDELIAGGAGQDVLDAYVGLLLKRGDLNASSTADAADVAALYTSFGPGAWLYDLNVDGTVNIADVATMITEVFRTVPGDFNLDGAVDASDYVIVRKSIGATGAIYTQGDADLDGDVDQVDLNEWQEQFGFLRQPLQPGGGSSFAVPEPTTHLLIATLTAILFVARQRSTREFKPAHASCLAISSPRLSTFDFRYS